MNSKKYGHLQTWKKILLFLSMNQNNHAFIRYSDFLSQTNLYHVFVIKVLKIQQWTIILLIHYKYVYSKLIMYINY